MTAVVVAAAVLLLARPWESDGGASGAPDFGDAELVLQDSDNKRRPATAEELVAFPLPIQLPADVPNGYRLAMVTRFEGPPGIDRFSFANNLLAVYRGAGAAALSLEQRPGSGVGSTDFPTEPVQVRGTEGWHVTIDRAEGVQQLVWSRCGRVFTLTSSPRDALTKQELLRVAESIGPDGCETS